MSTILIIYIVGMLITLIALRLIYLNDSTENKVAYEMDELFTDIIIVISWPIAWFVEIISFSLHKLFKIIDKYLLKLINKFK